MCPIIYEYPRRVLSILIYCVVARVLLMAFSLCILVTKKGERGLVTLLHWVGALVWYPYGT